MKKKEDNSNSIETEIRLQNRVSRVQEAVIIAVAASGILALSLLAPNAMKILNTFDLDNKIFKNRIRSVNNSRKRLVDNGLLSYTENGYIKLTPKGQNYLRTIQIKNYKIDKPKRWDGKWRIIVFDIKEKRRQIRDSIREKLGLIGFVKLQNSVWVYPYDCEDLISLTKVDSFLSREVLYIVAERIENEKVLLKHFKLKRGL